MPARMKKSVPQLSYCLSAAPPFFHKKRDLVPLLLHFLVYSFYIHNEIRLDGIEWWAQITVLCVKV